MAERNSSSTALRVAELRAAHQLVDGEPKILTDPVRLRLLDADVLDKIRAHPEMLSVPWVVGMRSHVLLRSRYTEDRLAEAVDGGAVNSSSWEPATTPLLTASRNGQTGCGSLKLTILPAKRPSESG